MDDREEQNDNVCEELGDYPYLYDEYLEEQARDYRIDWEEERGYQI